ncbi:uncharacterized protein ponzr2 isoform X2 [Nothobranchius furzeri]|uniref:uncharacterized protein ponzr2 isoform X2 n=1 Tax=Nothobranchius furzeri TaxID=105023 RepID=UPI0039047A36
MIFNEFLKNAVPYRRCKSARKFTRRIRCGWLDRGPCLVQPASLLIAPTCLSFPNHPSSCPPVFKSLQFCVSGCLILSGCADAIMTNRMVVAQPQPVMDYQNSQEWGTGICDCCQDVKSCCFAFWCCPCFACITSRDYGEHLCTPLLEIFGFGCIAPITMSMRVAMRHRYGIKGTIPKDCVYSTFCVPCSWCQMSREMKRRKIQIVLVNAKTS